jgi:hypothetical protein
MSNIIYSKDISWTTFSNEVFIFHEATNELFILKGLNKNFWLLLSQHKNLKEIINELTSSDDKDSSYVSDKVIRKANMLLKQNLIVVEDIS